MDLRKQSSLWKLIYQFWLSLLLHLEFSQIKFDQRVFTPRGPIRSRIVNPVLIITKVYVHFSRFP